MLLQPTPRGLDDYPEILEFGFPPELFFYFVGRGNQHRRISGATWSNASGNWFACDFAGHIQNLIDAIAIAATTQIVDATAPVHDSECQDVCPRKIDHVNVIAYAGAVRRGVIVTINFHSLTFSCCRLQCDRD